jgi:hypothetical protein
MRLNWGKSLILFFIVFFIWVISFVLFALRQNTDLVADDYYQKGAKYSDQIKINQRSATYQDSLQINIKGNKVELIPGKSLASAGDSVQIYFFRSSDKAKDLRFRFKIADAPFLIEKNKLSHGRYQVFVTWGKGEKQMMVKKILDVE